MRAFFRILLSLAALAFAAAYGAVRADEPLIVFAAASLKESLDEAGKAYQAGGGAELKISYANSLALARQLEQGAPADVFISADQASMDYAAGKNAIAEDSRFNLLGNQLVVVAGGDSALTSLDLTPRAFIAALGTGRLATGEVTSVPAGKYARAALEKLGLWATVEPRLAMAENVRAALVFVTRGEAPLGIVYATDALAEPKVKVVARFPPESHPPIVYPAALTTRSKNPAAPKLLTFLRSDAARAVFEARGFTVLK
jgi:molybdate transport system substrate-binding protein